MKKLFLLAILSLFWLNAHAQIDVEEVCRMNIGTNTERAQWGLDMRKEMLAKCKGTGQKCTQKYWDAIDKQNVTSKQALVEVSNRKQSRPETRMVMLSMIGWNAVAAQRGLRGAGSSADQIAYQIYSECTAGAAAAYEAGNAAVQSSAPQSSQGCNNYTIIGKNGQTQYCQKCCYGTNNCNVTCY